MKLRFWINEDSKHRADGDALTRLPDPSFRPRHCSGELGNGRCLAHDHPGDEQMGNFADLFVPVPAKPDSRPTGFDRAGARPGRAS